MTVLLFRLRITKNTICVESLGGMMTVILEPSSVDLQGLPCLKGLSPGTIGGPSTNDDIGSGPFWPCSRYIETLDTMWQLSHASRQHMEIASCTSN
ncbi:hypothetical protein NHQ30_005816 [Ciborinia camelliae]|nr:hypothetical protein NHQ30_005816 [Ciborinia camelliae]